jgi:hypothetical protein
MEELSREDMIHYADKLKTKITATTIDIHPKGLKPYQERQLSRYMCLTNHINPINFKKNDRRYAYLYAKPDKIGDTAYFAELYRMIENKNVLFTFYQDMMNRPVKKQLTILDIPITERMEEVMETNRDYVDEYAENFLGTKSPKEAFTEYCHYMEGENISREKIGTRKSFIMKFSQVYSKYGITKTKTDTVRPDGERVQVIYSKLALTMTA